MNFLKIIAIVSTSLLVSCGGDEGASREAQLTKWVKGKTLQYWKQSGYSELEDMVTLTVALESPYDVDYKPKPTWKKQSDARRYCPTQGEMAAMGFTGFKLKVITKGEKIGKLSEVICVR